MSIISFDSTQSAILAENLLLTKALKVNVMPLPSAIKAGCGIALIVNKEDIDRVILLLDTQIKDRYVIHELRD